jgi:enoyl-CoA hydratase/carnithine racemase
VAEVRIKRDEPAEHIVRLTLARPEKLNAFDQPMLDQLEKAIATLERDKETRAIILAAEGSKAFCAGADIVAWGKLEPLDMWRDWITNGNRLFDRLAQLRQPVIAAIDGIAYGGGLELALTADIRLATVKSRFALPETSIGTVPGWAGIRRLVKLIGLSHAKSMVLTADPIDAERALQSGLITSVVEAADLERESLTLAQTIASRGPVATQLAKAMLDQAANEEPGHALQGFASAVTAFSEDGREGTASFKEKRTPAFRGR